MQQIRVELATLGRSIGHYFTVVYKLNTPVNWQKNAYQPRIITSEDLKRLGPFKTWSGRVTRTRVSLRGKNSVLKARQNSGCRSPCSQACSGLFSADLFPQYWLLAEGRKWEQAAQVMELL